jgi:hypothetical protein
MQIAIDRLLGDPPPDDWNSPGAIAARAHRLGSVAQTAGTQMIELLIRRHDEQKRNAHLAEGGCVMVCVDALIDLHRALLCYRRGTVRFDGLDVARAAIERTHGVGIADLVLAALASLRAELDAHIRATLSQRSV